ncbi:MAG: DNA-processing protein DprA [Huintestinicola sp.]|uniref:DNA-processing protein DprA n=1 Tax=Huintestinicola sp. TaxID=2981661 RepID=UPI003F11A7B1
MNIDDGAYYRRLYRLWAVIAFGAASRTLSELYERFGNAESLYAAVTQDETVRNGLPAETVRNADSITLSSAERVMELCEKQKIKIVTADEEDFPARLKEIYNPPTVLFYKGDISGISDKLNIGVVGTRKPSDYSRKTAAAIVHTLAKHGFDIISGFAEGIDICAHLECIKSGGRTFAVVGSGLDYPYPKNNIPYREIIEENGAVISEFLPGTQPYPGNFLLRNRILAGLSMGVAVIEAGVQSGSLNSAAHAVSQGKPVFAVPPCDLFDSRYRGNVSLIREGAIPLMGARDIYGEYCINTPHIIVANENTAAHLAKIKEIADKAAEAERESAQKRASAVKSPRKKAENIAPQEQKPGPEKQPRSVSTEELESFSDPVQRKIIEKLSEVSSMRADELAEELSADIDEILTALTELEIMGNIQSQSGNYSISD